MQTTYDAEFHPAVCVCLFEGNSTLDAGMRKGKMDDRCVANSFPALCLLKIISPIAFPFWVKAHCEPIFPPPPQMEKAARR